MWLFQTKEQIWTNVIAQNLELSNGDDLEQHIDQERTAFDVAIPDFETWENVARESDAQS